MTKKPAKKQYRRRRNYKYNKKYPKSQYREAIPLTLQANNNMKRQVAVRHVYTNSFRIKRTDLTGIHKSLHLEFNASSPSAVFTNDALSNPTTYGLSMSGVGQNIFMDQLVNDNWNSNLCTAFPGYKDGYSINQKYKSCYVLGTKYYFNVRAITGEDSSSQYTVPVKVILSQSTGTGNLQSTHDTHHILNNGNVKSVKTVFGLYAAAKKANGVNMMCVHSPRKANGIPNGSYIGNPAFTGNTSTVPNSAVPSEKDTVILSIAAAGGNAWNGTSPELLIDCKIVQYVKYVEPISNANDILPMGAAAPAQAILG